MAPNIKERAVINDSLTILNVNDLIKFSLLTSSEIPLETEPQESLSHAYWEWPQDAKRIAIRNMMENEENRAMFSIHHVEANLIKEAQRLLELDVRVSHQDSHDYWDMPTNAIDIDDQRIEQIQDEYWEWPAIQKNTMEKEILTNRILQEERIRQILSIEHIEANLVKQAAELGLKDGKHDWNMVDKPHSKRSDSYWLAINLSDGLTTQTLLLWPKQADEENYPTGYDCRDSQRRWYSKYSVSGCNRS